jgi:prefoldin alpha subunit
MEDNEEQEVHENSSDNSDEQQSQQQLAIQFQMFEQQIRMLQEQLQAVEQAIINLGSLNLELDELIGKKDNEIMAPIGSGIYASAKLISEELLVDIGNKNFVKKSIPETKKIVQGQLKKLEKVKDELNGELEKINNELTKVFMEHQDGHKHSHECGCGEDCECGGDCEDEECECGEECTCEKDKKR